MTELDIENACQTSRSKPIGTTALDAAACNLSHLDEVAVSGKPTSTNRLGSAVDTLRGRLDKLGVLYDNPIRNITPNLVVSDLRAHRYPPTTGDIYIPTAPLPFTTGGSGSEFDSDNWVLLQGLSSNDLINDTSQAYEFKTLQDAIDFDDLVASKVCHIAERTSGNGNGATWDVVIGQVLPVSDGVVNHSTLNLQLVRRDNTFIENRLSGLIPSREVVVFSPKKALFAFHFDGPYITNFEALLDKAEELDVPVCIGSINDLTNGAFGGRNESANFGYVSNLVDAHRRGHEIYNHGFSSSLDLSPGTTVSENLQDFWINHSHEWLQSLGINAQMWVTSNGRPVTDQTPHLDPRYIPKILERHSVAFGRTSSPFNDANGFMGASYGADTPVNQQGLTRANIEGATQTQVESFIDWCIDNNRVAIFAGHDSGDPSELTVAEFESYVNYIKSRGCRVTTSQDVFASFTNLFSDDAVTAKAGNIAALESRSAIQENMLESTDLTDWVVDSNPSLGTVALTNIGAERSNGEQFSLAVTDPIAENSIYRLRRVINRPLNANDIATLCVSIEATSVNSGSFGVECIARFYDSPGGVGNEISEFRKGVILSDPVAFQMISADGTNFFTYNNVQSVRIDYEISNRMTWTGTRTLNLFNPRLNRGNIPSAFFKKNNPSVLWRGQQASTGIITLDKIADNGNFIKIEVGVNSPSNEVRGSELFAYNTHDNRTIRAWSSGGTTYTDFVVRFNSPTELEVLSETVVGGGDFAVIGVYKY